MADTNDPKGTMLEAMGIKTPVEPESKTPAEETKEPPVGEEKVYTQAQLDYFIQAAKSEQGRKAKQAEEELSRARQEVEQAKRDSSYIQAERDEIKQRMEQLTAEDPEKKNLAKLDADLRDQQRKLRAEQANIEADRKALQERLSKSEEGMRKYHIFNIANEYEGSDLSKLTSLCDSLGISGEEQIRTIADSFGWTKRNIEQPGPQIRTVSGHTSGGSQGLNPKQVKGMGAEDLIKNYKEIAKLPLNL